MSDDFIHPNRGKKAVSPCGNLINPRWLNEDGSYKTGFDLEVELLKVELAEIARRLLRVAKEWDRLGRGHG